MGRRFYKSYFSKWECCSFSTTGNCHQNSRTALNRTSQDEFPKHSIDNEIDSLQYFGFAGREQPEVVDKLNTILNRFGIGTKDFVALFYARKEDPDTIKRLMLIGHDNLVETKVKNVSTDAHRNSLTKLLTFNYANEKSTTS